MRAGGDVEVGLDEREHPLRAQIDEVRALTRSIHPDIREQWKWNAPTSSLRTTYLFTFHLRPLDHLHLVVHHPAAPEVTSDLLEGDYADGRRMIHLRGPDAVTRNHTEFTRVLRELVARTA